MSSARWGQGLWWAGQPGVASRRFLNGLRGPLLCQGLARG